MLLLIRFYLGAVYVFSFDPATSATFLSDGITLLSGLAHFILFFAWASVIDSPSYVRLWRTLSGYECLLLVVLLYDLAWWFLCAGQRFYKLELWMAINLLTALLCLVAHAIMSSFYSGHWKMIEGVVVLPVLFFSLFDIAEILTKQEIFRGFLDRLSGRSQ